MHTVMNGLRRFLPFLRPPAPPPVAAAKPDRRRFLLELLPAGSCGVEIGVHVGDFSRQLLDVARPRELHLIDPWRHETSATYATAWYGGRAKRGQHEMDERYAAVCARFAGEIRGGQVVVHRGDSGDILATFPDAHFDWVYIDGNHLYEFVRRDLELAFQKTKPGGLITGDDYHAVGWWEGGVKKAVDEALATREVHLVELRNGQFVIRNAPGSAAEAGSRRSP